VAGLRSDMPRVQNEAFWALGNLLAEATPNQACALLGCSLANALLDALGAGVKLGSDCMVALDLVDLAASKIAECTKARRADGKAEPMELLLGDLLLALSSICAGSPPAIAARLHKVMATLRR
jgi:hypothetical protein